MSNYDHWKTTEPDPDTELGEALERSALLPPFVVLDPESVESMCEETL